MSSWRWLRDGSGEAAVVTMDFGPGRPEASFTDLAANLTGNLTVLEPVFTHFAAGTPPLIGSEGYCRRVTEAIQKLEYRVVGVLGYCAGAGLACALARMLTAVAPPAPKVILYDPVRADPATLLRQYRSGITELSSALTKIEVEAAHAAAESAAPTQLLRLASHLSAQYQPVAASACTRLEFGPELTAELVERFDAYLRYLAIAAEAASVGCPRARPATATLLSRDQEPPAGLAQHCWRFDVSQARLLADPRVAAATADRLG
jgi:thioesterase domain-containing protein